MCKDQKYSTTTANAAPQLVVPAAVIVMLLVFFSAITIFIRRSSHFIADDFDHFSDVVNKSFFDMLRTPIDVHFVPFHKLESFLIFTISPLNFDVALAAMVSGWFLIVILLHFILRRLVSVRAAWLITLLVGASPVWIHTLIWWSSAAHRIPYLILQAVAVIFYLRYRERQQRLDSLLCVAAQVFALGFYVKAILFPVVFVALEICLAVQVRRLSRAGIRLISSMVVVSALYSIWYLFVSPVMRVSMGVEAIEIVSGSIKLLLRFSGSLINLPIEQSWSAWAAALVWGAVIGVLLWRKPLSIVPISLLITLLLVSNALTISGRGALIVSFPLWAMRYYVDELVLVGIFGALAIQTDVGASIKNSDSLAQVPTLLLAMVLIIGYPVSAYFSGRELFVKAYDNHQRTHDFMSGLMRSFKEASTQTVPPTILNADFPSFSYGFMGSRKSMAEIFGHVYPQLKWLQQPEQARGRIHQIGEDGQLRLAVLSDQPDFRDGISFPDWSIAEPSHRWSRDKHATILFSLRPKQKYKGQLLIKGPVLGSQRVAVRLNGTAIADIRLGETAECCSWSVYFPPDLLRADGLNAFEFDLPDARSPGNGDQRILAIGVQDVQVR